MCVRINERPWTDLYSWKTPFLGFAFYLGFDFRAIETKLSAGCHSLAYLLPLDVNYCPYLPPDSGLALSCLSL